MEGEGNEHSKLKMDMETEDTKTTGDCGRKECSPFVRTDESSEYSKRAIYAVHGFWSGDNVSVTQRRHYRTAEWEPPQVNWSCGGREPRDEPDDIKAAECFGLAVLDAVSVARQWMANNSLATQLTPDIEPVEDVHECVNMEPRCPHGNAWGICDACYYEADLAYDAAKERGMR